MTMNEAAMKSMFVETALNKMPTKPLILGIGIAGWGHHEKIKSRQVDNIYICGDEDSETADDFPPLAPRIGIVANMQANKALEILLKSNWK